MRWARHVLAVAALSGPGLPGCSSPSAAGEESSGETTAGTSSTGAAIECDLAYPSSQAPVLCGDVQGVELCYAQLESDVVKGRGSSVHLADLNQDGRDDVVLNLRDPGSVQVALSEAPCGLSAPSIVSAAGGGLVFVADINEDGALDLLAISLAGYHDSEVHVLLGDGTGKFVESMFVLENRKPTDIGDLDGDGHLDIVAISGDRIYFYTEDGTGAFVPAGSIGSPRNLASASVGDVDADGILDLLTVEVVPTDLFTPNFELVIRFGDHQSGFPERRPVGYITFPWPDILAVADLDEDGHLDLAITNSIWFGDGTGEMIESQIGLGSSLTAVDVDHDGSLDLVTSSDILLRRDGEFRGGFDGFDLPRAAQAADLDGDGEVDIAGFSWDHIYNEYRLQLLLAREP